MKLAQKDVTDNEGWTWFANFWCELLENLVINLHKTLNLDDCELSFEIVTVLDQFICTRRQVLFQIFRNSNCKIGFNTTAKKLFYLNNKISLEQLNQNFIWFKGTAKTLFMKYGKT